jgi:hypothetical protein
MVYSFYTEQGIKHVTNKTKNIKKEYFPGRSYTRSHPMKNLAIFYVQFLFCHTFATESYKSVPIGFATPGQLIHLIVKSNKSRTNEVTETKFDTAGFYRYANAT